MAELCPDCGAYWDCSHRGVEPPAEPPAPEHEAAWLLADFDLCEVPLDQMMLLEEGGAVP